MCYPHQLSQRRRALQKSPPKKTAFSPAFSGGEQDAFAISTCEVSAKFGVTFRGRKRWSKCTMRCPWNVNPSISGVESDSRFQGLKPNLIIQAYSTVIERDIKKALSGLLCTAPRAFARCLTSASSTSDTIRVQISISLYYHTIPELGTDQDANDCTQKALAFFG